MLTGQAIGGHIGDHDCSRLITHKGVPQHLDKIVGMNDHQHACWKARRLYARLAESDALSLRFAAGFAQCLQSHKAGTGCIVPASHERDSMTIAYSSFAMSTMQPDTGAQHLAAGLVLNLLMHPAASACAVGCFCPVCTLKSALKCLLKVVYQALMHCGMRQAYLRQLGAPEGDMALHAVKGSDALLQC